jgi:hypothetical protein
MVLIIKCIYYPLCGIYRSQWPRCLRQGPSSLARTLESWVQIPLKAWMFECVLCVCSGLAMGWSPSWVSYQLCKKYYETEEAAVVQKAVEP